MDPIVITLSIVFVVLVLFITELIPLPFTAVLGALAMVAFGVLSFKEAFAGFGSDTLMMVAGMMIIGQAVSETGLTTHIGLLFSKISFRSERSNIAVFTSVTGLLSGFMSNTAVVAATLPLIDSMQKQMKGRIKKKNLAIALGTTSVLGGNLTLIGSTPQLVAQGIMQESGFQGLNFFTLFAIGFPLLVLSIVYYTTVGYAITQKMSLTREPKEIETIDVPPSTKGSPFRKALTAIVFSGCALAFISGFWSVGLIALTGALILIIGKCVALEKVDWSSVILLGGSLGFAEGLSKSGAGERLAWGITNLCGGDHAVPLFAFASIVVLVFVLSQFMSNTAIVAMVAPIGIYTAQLLGFSVEAMVIGIVIAASLAFVTPIGTPPMTMTIAVGYRFIDYVKAGLPLSLILLVATIVLVPLLYGT